jgi:hypothetical protein
VFQILTTCPQKKKIFVIRFLPMALVHGNEEIVVVSLSKLGVLHVPADSTVASFSSPLYRWIYLIRRCTKTPTVGCSFEEFIEGVITRINPTLLRKTFSKSLNGDVLEYHWHVEFYRCGASLLPPTLSPRA